MINRIHPIILLLIAPFLIFQTQTAHSAKSTASTLYTFEIKDIDGKTVPLSRYKNKVLLIVNTASQCGYTPQYEGLQKLHQKYGKQGFEVLGFPSNNFGGQEPGSNQKIKKFCKMNYGVKFDLFEKVDVIGKNAAPLFKEISGDQPIRWNFEKFLFSREGKLIGRYKSNIRPLSKAITQTIEAALK